MTSFWTRVSQFPYMLHGTNVNLTHTLQSQANTLSPTGVLNFPGVSRIWAGRDVGMVNHLWSEFDPPPTVPLYDVWRAERVYWLPWLHGTITWVPWAWLAGAGFFLTSRFTGCRFVANDFGVSHVAWGQIHGGPVFGAPPPPMGTSISRDVAEVQLFPAVTRRRAMSMTQDSLLPGTGTNYTSNPFLGGQDGAVVVGSRTGPGLTDWVFWVCVQDFWGNPWWYNVGW